ncbi:hypothetical protein AB0N33_17880 [Pseudarthrobacter oxydans]|uniref:hypothetical protein n=1 Tax=Pseudarthrobacter oxydans TaxID=1671 RepID=UPI00342C492E
MSEKQINVYGGIDMHADTHHVAVIDATGHPGWQMCRCPLPLLVIKRRYGSWERGHHW